MHPNARLIETLYSSLRDDKPDAAAACYAPDAHFEDIAFRLDGRERILQIWRLVCSQKVGVTFGSVVADEQQGGASCKTEGGGCEGVRLELPRLRHRGITSSLDARLTHTAAHAPPCVSIRAS
jgi:hypothetical protein